MNPPTEPIFRPSFVRLLAVQPLAGFAICTFYLLPKFLATELHATPTEIGYVSASFGIAGALAVPLLGVLLDRFSPRRLLLGACLLLAATAVGFVWVDRVGPLALALRTAQGLAWAVLFTAGMMLTITTAPESRLAEAIGYYGVANLAMNAVAPAIAETVADRVGWTPVFLVAAAAAFAGLALSFSLPDERPSRAAAPTLWKLARRPQSLAMIAVVAVWGWAFGAMFIFNQPFALSVGITKLRGFFIAYTAIAIASRVGMGKTVDRIGRYGVSVASLSLYAAVVFAMQALRPGLLELCGAAFGLAHGLFFPAYSALVIERARREERGKLMALTNAAFNAGFAASSVALGRVAEGSGYPHAYLVAGFVTSAGVVLLVATTRSTRAPLERPVVAPGSIE